MKRLKNKTVHSKNTTRKLNNSGMTYMELLVALSLLVLIVTLFTPMLLNSYDTLYKAGERTEYAYDARSTIEAGLSVRENDNPYDIKTNFEKLTSTVSIKAKQIISSVNGLETLYGGARGRLKVISDSVVSDNQDAQLVRLLVTNLDKSQYTFKKSTSATAAQNPAEGEVLFYVCSVFNDSVQLDYDLLGIKETEELYESNYVDVFIKNINVTKGPVKFLAYFRDDFGSIKKAETYLYIEPADIMFVGDSGTVDYFTSAGVDAERGTLYIAGRQMDSAPINGEMLNDVEWVGVENDSTILDGYYLMCGESSVVRRLWRTRDSSKTSDGITYNTTAINGNAYFQYDWKGDYTDQYQFSVSDTDAVYSESNHPYSLDGGYLSYGFNGYTVERSDLVDKGWYDSKMEASNRRISYVNTTGTLEEATNQGFVTRMGLWSKFQEKQPYWGSSWDRFNQGNDEDHLYAYNKSDHYWYYRSGKNSKTKQEDMYGGGAWIAGRNADYFDDITTDLYNKYKFYIRKKTVGTAWGTNETIDSDIDDDATLAPLILKSYNNYSINDLCSETWANAPTSNNISLTSCNVLPGKSLDTLYLGYKQAFALINETTGFDTYESDFRENGFFKTWAAVGYGDNLKFQLFQQNNGSISWWISVLESHNGSDNKISPDTFSGVRALANGDKNYANWGGTLSNVRFTMGYSSNLSAVFDALVNSDKTHKSKPLESVYLNSNGRTVADSSAGDYNHLWFPREFLNLTESDSYNKSVIAVGYNVSGYSTHGYMQGFSEPGRNDFTILKAYADSTGKINVPDNSSYWREGKQYWDGYFGLSASGDDGSDFLVELPANITSYTELETITNDGVLSVYNEGDNTFTPIYYYKDANKQSIRFNCVSTIQLDSNTVGAAIGLSNGSVMLAKIPYANGKLSTAALTSASADKTDPIAYISSISAVKAFHYDSNGDGESEMFVLAGGVCASGEVPTLRLCDITDLSKYNEYVIQLDTATDITEITDIALVNGYVYVSAKTSGGKGVIYSFVMSELKKVSGRGIAENSGKHVLIGTSTDPINTSAERITIKKTVKYYTSFGVDSATGTVVGSGDGVDLPVINSIAAKAEQ